MKERPIEYCYWVTDNLLAGEYPGDLDEQKAREKVASLLDAGVSIFIDLTEGENERAFIRGSKLRPYADLAGQAAHLQFPIQDMGVPESPELTKEILDSIDRNIANGCTVYVHCLGGVGRTGTIIGCWLSRHNGYDGNAALRGLRELWKENPKSQSRSTPERDHQVDYVCNWREP